jgi:hypothetical protein
MPGFRDLVRDRQFLDRWLRQNRTVSESDRRTLIVVKRINCVCGIVVEGDDDDELWDNAQQHLMADHPDLVGKVTRDDIVAQAEELA